MAASAGSLAVCYIGVGAYDATKGIPSWTGDTPSLTDPNTYYAIADLKEIDGTIDGKNVDVTPLNQTAIARIHVMTDTKYTLTGFYNYLDTNGQAVLWQWVLALASTPVAAPLMLKFEPTGSDSVGWKQMILPSEIAVKAIVGDAVTNTIQLEGNGPVALLS